MSDFAPWVNGTVTGVAEEIRALRARSTDPVGMGYTAVVGMIGGLVKYDTRPPAERLEDIRTVLAAHELVHAEVKA